MTGSFGGFPEKNLGASFFVDGSLVVPKDVELDPATLRGALRGAIWIRLFLIRSKIKIKIKILRGMENGI